MREEFVLFEVETRGAHRPQCPVASGVPARPVWGTFGDVLTWRLLGEVPYTEIPRSVVSGAVAKVAEGRVVIMMVN